MVSMRSLRFNAVKRHRIAEDVPSARASTAMREEDAQRNFRRGSKRALRRGQSGPSSPGLLSVMQESIGRSVIQDGFPPGVRPAWA